MASDEQRSDRSRAVLRRWTSRIAMATALGLIWVTVAGPLALRRIAPAQAAEPGPLPGGGAETLRPYTGVDPHDACLRPSEWGIVTADPGEARLGGVIPPNAFDPSLELIILAREHLLQYLFTDNPFALEDSAVEVGD